MICWRCKFNKECDGLKIRSCEDFLPRTNGDLVRSMTDEELTNALAHKADACWNCSSDSLDICKDCWLDWLKEEVE